MRRYPDEALYIHFTLEAISIIIQYQACFYVNVEAIPKKISIMSLHGQYIQYIRSNFNNYLLFKPFCLLRRLNENYYNLIYLNVSSMHTRYISGNFNKYSLPSFFVC